MGAQDRDARLNTRLLVRGELDKPGQLVQPGFVQVAYHGALPNFEGSGRLQLADWIADAENPLTARVIANRVWNWLFGQGLVRSLDDFGATGEEPSHPELLDHLAIRLVEHDLSLKAEKAHPRDRPYPHLAAKLAIPVQPLHHRPRKPLSLACEPASIGSGGDSRCDADDERESRRKPAGNPAFSSGWRGNGRLIGLRTRDSQDRRQPPQHLPTASEKRAAHQPRTF